MSKKQKIIKEVEHYINSKYNLGIIDDKIVKDCINKTLEAINYTRCYQLLKLRIMDLQELLEMNIEIANLINAPQVNLPPIIKGLVQKLINENEAKLEELTK